MEAAPGPDSIVLAIAGVAVALTLSLIAIFARVTRPRRPRTSSPTMDLGPEPPAVVNLLTGGFEVTPEAIPATLLDLAAHGWVTIEEPARGRVQVRLGRKGGELTAYARRVLAHVRGLMVNGVVPAEALTSGPEVASRAWWTAFRREVIEDVRGRGLCRARWGARQLSAMWTAVVVSGVLLALSLQIPEWRTGQEAEPNAPFIAVGALLLAGALLVSRLSGSSRQRDTDEGLAVAGRWLAVRRYLVEAGDFGNKPAASVVIWERYLAYAAAMDLATVAVRQLPLGAEDDRRAWSRLTREWRQVRVRYPRWQRPGWGLHPVAAIFLGGTKALLLGVLGLLALDASGGGPAELSLIPDQTLGWVEGVLRVLGSLLMVMALYQAIIGLLGFADLFVRRRVDGVVLRRRVYRGGDWMPDVLQRLGHSLRRRPGEAAPSKQRRFIAVDAGESDEVQAWRLKPDLYARASQGSVVRVVVSPLLGYVANVEVVEEAKAREEPAALQDVVEEAAEGAVAAARKPGAKGGLAAWLLGRLEELEDVRDSKGRPVLDHADREGITLRDRLREGRSWIGEVRTEERP